MAWKRPPEAGKVVSKGFKDEIMLHMAWKNEVSVPGVSVGGGRMALRSLIILMVSMMALHCEYGGHPLTFN